MLGSDRSSVVGVGATVGVVSSAFACAVNHTRVVYFLHQYSRHVQHLKHIQNPDALSNGGRSDLLHSLKLAAFNNVTGLIHSGLYLRGLQSKQVEINLNQGLTLAIVLRPGKQSFIKLLGVQIRLCMGFEAWLGSDPLAPEVLGSYTHSKGTSHISIMQPFTHRGRTLAK